MKKTYDTNAETVTFTFDGLDPVMLHNAALTDAVRTQAMYHGLVQKIGDAAAIPKSAENGFIVTEAMRRDAVQAMVGQLVGGNWNAPTKTRAPARSPVIAALAAKAGITYEEMEAKLANADIAALLAA